MEMKEGIETAIQGLMESIEEGLKNWWSMDNFDKNDHIIIENLLLEMAKHTWNIISYHKNRKCHHK